MIWYRHNVPCRNFCIGPQRCSSCSYAVIWLELWKARVFRDFFHHVPKSVYTNWSVFVPHLLLKFRISLGILKECPVFSDSACWYETSGISIINEWILGCWIRSCLFFDAAWVSESIRMFFSGFIVGHRSVLSAIVVRPRGIGGLCLVFSLFSRLFSFMWLCRSWFELLNSSLLLMVIPLLGVVWLSFEGISQT